MSVKDTKPPWPAELDAYAAEQFVASLPDRNCDDLLDKVWVEAYGRGDPEEKLNAIKEILNS